MYSFTAPTRISQGKYVRASCSGLFSEQCNSKGTRLQCRAAYHPVSLVMNINQRRILTGTQTTECVLARQSDKRQLIYGQENISFATVWWRKMFQKEKSKQERAVCQKESQACSQWLSRFYWTWWHSNCYWVFHSTAG